MAKLPAAGPIKALSLYRLQTDKYAGRRPDEYKTDQYAGCFADLFAGFYTD